MEINLIKKEFYNVPYIYESLQHKNPISEGFSLSTSITVQVPGSKSITNRALLLATLANGTSTIHGALFSDDSRHFLKCIQSLGFETKVNEEKKEIQITGHGGNVPEQTAALYVGSAGTAARFLTAYLGISKGVYFMDASDQMRKRPMAPLLESLIGLGCNVTYSEKEGCFPFILKGNGFHANTITINIDHSSQFLSALLIAACLSKEDFTVHIEGSHGMAYIQMTLEMINQFGVSVDTSKNDCFVIPSGQKYNPLSYLVEPDISGACYFYALAPLLSLPIMVEGVHLLSLQGDIQFLHVLEQMGCSISDTELGVIVHPPTENTYHGVDVDMSAFSDQAITLAAIAPFADSPTTIRGISHIRYQECNRFDAIITELTKMGITCTSTEDSITIYPGIPIPCTIETYDDHRMAMGFALTGLRADGIVIKDPACCRKTFENYFEVLEGVLFSPNMI